MFCRDCGNNIGDAKFCPYCGAASITNTQENATKQQPANETTVLKEQPAVVEPEVQEQPAAANPVVPEQQPAFTSPVTPTQQAMPQYTSVLPGDTRLGMKWYKFLLVVLILGALANIGSAVKSYTGMAYEEKIKIPGFTAEALYEVCDGLEFWDKMMGVAGFVVAALQITARVMLANYKKNAPMFLYATYIVTIVARLLYAFEIYNIIPSGRLHFGDYYVLLSPDNLVMSSVGVALVMSVLVVLNIIYFNKRKHLFNN